LISFTTFFILLVITSSLAGGDDDDKKDKKEEKKENEDDSEGILDSAEDNIEDAVDALKKVPKSNMLVIGGVVGGLFVVIILLVCLFYPKCPMYPLSAPCRDYCCPDFVNPFNRETAVKREVKGSKIETTKGQWITPVEDA